MSGLQAGRIVPFAGLALAVAGVALMLSSALSGVPRTLAHTVILQVEYTCDTYEFMRITPAAAATSS